MSVGSELRRDALVVLLNLTALGVITWRLRDPRADAVRLEPPPTPAPTATVARAPLRVYVSGAVAAPAVVVVAADSRVGDAVRAAGGLTDRAVPEAINLAAPLADGQHVHVPVRGEATAPDGPGATAAASASGAPQAATTGGDTADTRPSAAGEGTGTGAGAGGAGSGTVGAGMVNINAASADELDSLPGIGPALAARIVDYRDKHGPFASPQDLLKVAGIGEKTLARFADRVVVR